MRLLEKCKALAIAAALPLMWHAATADAAVIYQSAPSLSQSVAGQTGTCSPCTISPANQYLGEAFTVSSPSNVQSISFDVMDPQYEQTYIGTAGYTTPYVNIGIYNDNGPSDGYDLEAAFNSGAYVFTPTGTTQPIGFSGLLGTPVYNNLFKSGLVTAGYSGPSSYGPPASNVLQTDILTVDLGSGGLNLAAGNYFIFLSSQSQLLVPTLIGPTGSFVFVSYCSTDPTACAGTPPALTYNSLAGDYFNSFYPPLDPPGTPGPDVGVCLSSITPSSCATGGTPTALTPPPVPEPATWALLLMGFGGMGAALRQSRSRALRRGALVQGGLALARPPVRRTSRSPRPTGNCIRRASPSRPPPRR